MSNEDDNDYKQILKKHKPKKKITVPAEFLQEAKSYEDKLGLVKILTEQEKNRVILIVKSMLKDAVAKRDKK